MVYMTSTTNLQTKEAIKVMNTACIYIFVHFLQAWKGMLDGNSFIFAGWVHDLLLHTFQLSEPNTVRYLIKGKVSEMVMSLLTKLLYI